MLGAMRVRRPRRWDRLAVLPAVGLVLASCGSGGSCTTTPVPATCPDLLVRGKPYVVWQEVTRPSALQEVANATYPACNLSDQCGGDPLEGDGATDVWRYDGVPRWRAVIGLLEGTDTYAVYVRRGVDTSTLPQP